MCRISLRFSRRFPRTGSWSAFPTRTLCPSTTRRSSRTIKRLFGDAEFAPVKHEAILGEMAAKAKVIVRTGAFDPWGNILLYSGVDVPAWFAKPGVKAPDYYAKKLKKG